MSPNSAIICFENGPIFEIGVSKQELEIKMRENERMCMGTIYAWEPWMPVTNSNKYR